MVFRIKSVLALHDFLLVLLANHPLPPGGVEGVASPQLQASFSKTCGCFSFCDFFPTNHAPGLT